MRRPGVRRWTTSELMAIVNPFPSLRLVPVRAYLVATQALRQKKVYENELDSIAGRKITLETQVS